MAGRPSHSHRRALSRLPLEADSSGPVGQLTGNLELSVWAVLTPIPITHSGIFFAAPARYPGRIRSTAPQASLPPPSRAACAFGAPLIFLNSLSASTCSSYLSFYNERILGGLLPSQPVLIALCGRYLNRLRGPSKP